MRKNSLHVIIIGACVAMLSITAFAQTEKTQPFFSHKGFKLSLALGGANIPAESQFKTGQVGEFNLGYGFSDKSTLWLGISGAELPDKSSPDSLANFGGIELEYQYKFLSESRFQPYGKIGIGGYAFKIKDSDTIQAGGGLQFALGADYFLSRHVGIGFEINLKDIEYISETEDNATGKKTRNLEPHLNRDARAFLVTLTLQ